MTTRMPVEDRRAQLVEAALAVAASEGIGAATVRRVAEEAGVALGVVHYCFADKDELFAALATRIVDELARAGSEGLAFDGATDLAGALHAAVAALWDTIEVTRGAQLLTYEITTHALRDPDLHAVARRQYEVSHAAAASLLALAADASGAAWVRPLDDVAGEALAFVDGVTLRWLVDGDSAAARARLDGFAAYLATQAKAGRRRARQRAAS
ncbi:MAG: regulatory protein TetR [Pseudonocardiales bacterium]|nr:regulatory protein TetR [Pseudonocardiales bacterium]